MIVPFSVLFGLLVIFGQRIINAVISVLTFIKGSLLVVLVLVTMMVGLKVKQPISDDWVYIGRPLLIGTVALGGAPFVLPVVFSKVAWRAADMIKFSLAAVSGLLVVFVLNVLWCFYVLRIVPQTGPEGSISLTKYVTIYFLSRVSLVTNSLIHSFTHSLVVHNEMERYLLFH